MTNFFIRQPGTLENFAIRKFGDWMALQAEKLMLTPNMPEDLLSTHIEGIQLLIYKVPYMLHDKVVSEALNSMTQLRTKTLTRPDFSQEAVYFSLDSEIEELHKIDIIKRVTETLFTENLTSLTFRDNQIQVFESYILTGLTNLQINCSDCKEVDVIKFLKQLPNLKSFEYWNSCTETGVKCIVENCKLIEKLHLFYTEGINDACIDLIIQLPNLISLKLYETSVTVQGVETLLKACKKVESIDVISARVKDACIINALINIASSKTDKIQLKLKSFYDGNNPTVEDLQIIAEVCPFIQEISIFKSNTPDCIELIKNFQNLHTLKLFYFNFYKDHIKQQLLEVTNLVKLWLVGVKIDLNALAFVSQRHPNLETLFIDFIKPSAVDCFNRHEVKILPFKKLTNLFIDGDPHEDELIFILSNCPNVKDITFAHLMVLTDNVILRVLEKNPLRCLKEFCINRSKLTKSVIHRIVQNNASLEMQIDEQLVEV